MSLKRPNTFNSNGKLFILKLRTKDLNDKPTSPYFEISEKDPTDNKWKVSSEQTTYVSGNLVKLELKEWQWEGETYNNVNVYLADGEDLYLLDLKTNMLSRSLFNQLLSLDTFENLSISTYSKASKKDETKEYPAISLRQNDELVHWKFGLDEMPKPAEVMFKGKKMRDYQAVDNFFLAKLVELGKKVGGNKKVKSVNTPVTTPQVVDSKDNTPDDVPF